MKMIIKFTSILAASLFMLGCTKDISPSTYDTEQIGYAARVEPGVISSMRNIKVDQNTGIGGIAGAGAGAAAGSTIGGSREANVIGAIGGAVIGGLAGNAAEGAINQQQGVEYIVKLDNGSSVSVAQPNGLNLSVGQRVNVIYGKTTRIIPDNSHPNQGGWTDPHASASEKNT